MGGIPSLPWVNAHLQAPVGCPGLRQPRLLDSGTTRGPSRCLRRSALLWSVVGAVRFSLLPLQRPSSPRPASQPSRFTLPPLLSLVPSLTFFSALSLPFTPSPLVPSTQLLTSTASLPLLSISTPYPSSQPSLLLLRNPLHLPPSPPPLCPTRPPGEVCDLLGMGGSLSGVVMFLLGMGVPPQGWGSSLGWGLL